MGNPNRDKGMRAEREIAGLLTDLTGYDVHRITSPGSQHDTGDLFGLPDTVAQVAYWPARTLAAYVEKPVEADEQRRRAGCTHAVSFIRHKGGMWRAAMTLEQFSTMWGEHR